MFVYLIAICAFIVYVKWRHSYWTRRGMFQIRPEFLFGNSRKMLGGKTSFVEFALERYNIIKSSGQKFGGAYIFLEPAFVPVDPLLIKCILQKDFAHFMNHGLYHHPKDILSMNLFMMEGDAWKNLRTKLTPTFTSGKMKMMFETMVDKTRGLEKLVFEYAGKQEPFAIKDILGRFTTDIIGSCAFGIECNSLEDPDNAFRTYGSKVFKPSLSRMLMVTIFPWWFLGNVGFKADGKDVTEFFTNIVKETIKSRETNSVFRKDFIHVLLQLKNQKPSDSETDNKSKYTLSENEIIAQCFIFFLAGFETSSTLMTFALLELAQNLDIQDKLREEINLVLDKYDRRVTYDSVMEMTYLDKVINETLRKFSPVASIPRKCTKPYTIPDTNIVIEKGTRVLIPVWGLHRDPEYYPDPERFDPERFNEENKSKRPDLTFLPFGEGPRMCIGIRFGMLQSKIGLISLIKNFKFSLNEKTPLPIKLAANSIVISVKGDVWLDAAKI